MTALENVRNSARFITHAMQGSSAVSETQMVISNIGFAVGIWPVRVAS